MSAVPTVAEAANVYDMMLIRTPIYPSSSAQDLSSMDVAMALFNM